MRIDGSIDGEHNDSVEEGVRANYWALRATCGGRGDVRRARRHCHAASTRRRRCARLSWATCSGVGCAILLRLVDVWRCHTRRLMPDVKRYVTRRAPIVRSSERQRGTRAPTRSTQRNVSTRTYPVTPRACRAQGLHMIPQCVLPRNVIFRPVFVFRTCVFAGRGGRANTRAARGTHCDPHTPQMKPARHDARTYPGPPRRNCMRGRESSLRGGRHARTRARNDSFWCMRSLVRRNWRPSRLDRSAARYSMLIVRVRAIDGVCRRRLQPGHRGPRGGFATTRTH